jgi:hypothetical protein
MQTDFINAVCDALGLSKRLIRVTIDHDFSDSNALTKVTCVEVPKGELNLPTINQFVLQEIVPKVKIGDTREMAGTSALGDQRRMWIEGTKEIAIWSYERDRKWRCVGLEPVVPNDQCDGEPPRARESANPTGS